MPFGLRTAGNTFVRCIQIIIQPIRDFCYSFIDDMSVCSDSWDQHLDHLKRYLTVIREAGLVLHMKKTSFAMSEVKFVGHIIGSGKHRPDPDKLSAVAGMSKPETKRDVRRIIGFFSYFRSYLPHFAHTSKVLTDLTQKEKPTKVVWTEVEEKAFQELKRQLCEECTRIQLYTVDYGKPFGLLVDASGFAVESCHIQWDEEGKERPIAFASAKLAGAQLAWSTIEREAYGVIWALNKFRTWIFGAETTVFCDHNPLTYLTLNSPKSAKLTRYRYHYRNSGSSFHFVRAKTTKSQTVCPVLGVRNLSHGTGAVRETSLSRLRKPCQSCYVIICSNALVVCVLRGHVTTVNGDVTNLTKFCYMALGCPSLSWHLVAQDNNGTWLPRWYIFRQDVRRRLCFKFIGNMFVFVVEITTEETPVCESKVNDYAGTISSSTNSVHRLPAATYVTISYIVTIAVMVVLLEWLLQANIVGTAATVSD